MCVYVSVHSSDETLKSVHMFTLIISRTSSKVKVIGHDVVSSKVMRSMSTLQGQGHEVKVIGQVKVTGEKLFKGMITVSYGEREVCQRWGVFMIIGCCMSFFWSQC